MMKPLILNPVQVRYVKTVVGWYNVYLADKPSVKPVTMSPEQFREILPEVSPKARFGCDEIDRKLAKSLFNSLRVSKTA